MLYSIMYTLLFPCMDLEFIDDLLEDSDSVEAIF